MPWSPKVKHNTDGLGSPSPEKFRTSFSLRISTWAETQFLPQFVSLTYIGAKIMMIFFMKKLYYECLQFFSFPGFPAGNIRCLCRQLSGCPLLRNSGDGQMREKMKES